MIDNLISRPREPSITGSVLIIQWGPLTQESMWEMKRRDSRLPADPNDDGRIQKEYEIITARNGRLNKVHLFSCQRLGAAAFHKRIIEYIFKFYFVFGFGHSYTCVLKGSLGLKRATDIYICGAGCI